MPIDWLIAATAAGPVVGAAVGVALERAVQRRPKLLTYYGHVSSHRITTDSGPVSIFTHDIVVRNSGGKSAKNVRLGHTVLPKDYQVIPALDYEVRQVPGGAELFFPVLVPGEQFTVSYVYYPPLTYNSVNSYVKSEEGLAKVITVLPQAQYSKWFTVSATLFFLVGVITALYIAITAIRQALF